MPLEEVQRKYANLPLPKKFDFGESTISIDAKNYPELIGMKYMDVQLVDDKVAKITVYYPTDLNWSVEDLAKRTAEAFNLNGTWTKGSSENRYVGCGEGLNLFTVDVGIENRSIDNSNLLGGRERLPYITLKNPIESFQPVIRKIDAEKQANQNKEEQKRVFQP